MGGPPVTWLAFAVTVRLVLASASPARRTALRRAGVEPTVHVSDVDEAAVEEAARQAYGELAPADVALLLARAKAEAVATALPGDHLVLACDSVLELDGEALGKPRDAADAAARWRAMRGRSGVLHTGHWLVDDRDEGTGGVLGSTASTTVHFGDVTDEDIEAYVASGEPLHVAGAFTLEGRGAPYVDGVEGDPGNVMGLSLPLLRRLLGELGLPFHALCADPTGGQSTRNHP